MRASASLVLVQLSEMESFFILCTAIEEIAYSLRCIASWSACQQRARLRGFVAFEPGLIAIALGNLPNPAVPTEPSNPPKHRAPGTRLVE